MVPLAPLSLSRFEVLDARADDRFAWVPVFLNDESLAGIGLGVAGVLLGPSPFVADGSSPVEAASACSSSLITDSTESGSRRGVVMPLGELEFPPAAPMLALFFSASSRSLSLLLMYINPRWFLPCLLPQLSADFCFLTEFGSPTGEVGSDPRSMLSFPMLSIADVNDPLLEGRERPPLLLRESRLLRPDASRLLWLLGDLGAVSGDLPLGGFEVRTTGALAESSSRGKLSCSSRSEGRENAP